jgi:O-antigen ligase
MLAAGGGAGEPLTFAAAEASGTIGKAGNMHRLLSRETTMSLSGPSPPHSRSSRQPLRWFSPAVRNAPERYQSFKNVAEPRFSEKRLVPSWGERPGRRQILSGVEHTAGPDLNVRPAWIALLCAMLCAAPLFVLTLRGWSNIVLFCGAIVCTALLLWHPAAAPSSYDSKERRYATAVLLALFLPLVSVAWSSLWRLDPYPSPFDSPSRLWAAIPIFLAVRRYRLDPSRILQFALPLGLAVTLGHQLIAPQPRLWGPERMSTYFADPLVFGYLSLAFGLMCLMSISLRDDWRERPWVFALQGVAVMLGLYLSIRSGSRSGWLAIPVIVGIWLHLNVRPPHRRGRAMVPYLALLFACVLAVAAYELVPRVQTRILEAVSDLSTYSFHGVAPDSPVGLRVTFLRIAADLIVAHPVGGVGDTAHMPPMPLDAFPYASALAVETAFESAFHNQIISNTVRYGVFGGFAAALLLFVPLVVYGRHLRSGNEVARRNARMGLAYSICIVVSSLTTEVVDLKYTASLYALLTALLCGASLAKHGQE